MRTISVFRIVRFPAFLIAAIACVGQANAIEVTIDYTYDTDGFFAPGSQARAAIEAAASFYSTKLEDTFAEIDVPDKFYGSRGGEATWFWKRRFINPETGFTEAKVNPDKIDANKYVVFVGARDLPNSGELGLAGPGGFVSGFVLRNGDFTEAEKTEINAIQATFADAVLDRGETSGFGRWGGSISFDSEADWHFNHTTNPPVDITPSDPSDDIHDFYSVALHELTHALGFGADDDDSTNKTPWENLVNGTNFTGANAAASYTDAVNAPLASSSDTGHWKAGITSTVYDESGSQVALMVPSIPGGTRRLLTDLDAAALADIGWDIDLPASSASAASFVSLGSVNLSSGSTSVAALSVSPVPEPASAMLAVFAGSLLVGLRRRR
jgi:hypothetical protein